MRFTDSRAARLFAAGAVLGLGVLGGAVAVMAVEDSNSSPTEPTSATEVVVTDSTAAPTSAPANTEAPTTTAAAVIEPQSTEAPQPTGPTLAKGFESYKAGDALPTPPPAPTEQEPTVSTVPGPYGPIYPDGYVAPEYRDQPPVDWTEGKPLPTAGPPSNERG